MDEKVDEIERIKNLLDSGAINKAEFDILKSKILENSETIESFVEIEESSFLEENNNVRNFLIFCVAVIVVIFFLFGDITPNFFRQSDENIAEQARIAALDAANSAEQSEGANPVAMAEPNPARNNDISYEFRINQEIYENEYTTSRIYKLENRSTGPVEISSVRINKRDDCVAYVREKDGKYSLSQYERSGEIQSHTNFPVGMSARIIYDYTDCGLLIYADVMMRDGSVYEMKSL